ncbi:MAG: hypothetical protein ACTSQQ_15285, partial [Candidatus Helarchaeota archaeon]
MKKDVVDIYNDENECIAREIPVKAFAPLYNPYIIKIIRFIKRTAFVSLEQLEQNYSKGRYGEMTSLRKDEIQLNQYIRKWKIINSASEIAAKMQE